MALLITFAACPAGCQLKHNCKASKVKNMGLGCNSTLIDFLCIEEFLHKRYTSKKDMEHK